MKQQTVATLGILSAFLLVMGAGTSHGSHRFAVRTRELTDRPTPHRGANQSLDLTFCPVNRALRAH